MGPPFSPHSPQAQAIAGVFSVVLVIAAVVFLVVAAGVVYSSVRYRSRGLAAPEPRQIFGSRTLEIVWTVVPLLIVTGLFIVTVRAMVLIDAPQDSSPDLVITGHQWWWEARYIDDSSDRSFLTANELHIPIGKPVRGRTANWAASSCQSATRSILQLLTPLTQCNAVSRDCAMPCGEVDHGSRFSNSRG